jgi:hypothetical protein
MLPPRPLSLREYLSGDVPEAGADREILDSLRHEHLAWRRTRRYTCADRDGDPSDLRVDQLDFACMDTNSHCDTQGLDGVDNRTRAADRAGRPVERAKKPSPAVSTSVPLYRPIIARMARGGARRRPSRRDRRVARPSP